MDVTVERYKRKKYAGQADSPELFYLRPKTGSCRTLSTRELTQEIQDNTSLKRGEVLHVTEELIEQIVKNLTKGNKVKLNGLGTFHMTLNSEGSEKEEDCTIKTISKVNIRFVADKDVKLVNGTSIPTRSPNSVDFVLFTKDKNKESGGSGDSGDSGDSGEVVDPKG